MSCAMTLLSNIGAVLQYEMKPAKRLIVNAGRKNDYACILSFPYINLMKPLSVTFFGSYLFCDSFKNETVGFCCIVFCNFWRAAAALLCIDFESASRTHSAWNDERLPPIKGKKLQNTTNEGTRRMPSATKCTWAKKIKNTSRQRCTLTNNRHSKLREDA